MPFSGKKNRKLGICEYIFRQFRQATFILQRTVLNQFLGLNSVTNTFFSDGANLKELKLESSSVSGSPFVREWIIQDSAENLQWEGSRRAGQMSESLSGGYFCCELIMLYPCNHSFKWAFQTNKEQLLWINEFPSHLLSKTMCHCWINNLCTHIRRNREKTSAQAIFIDCTDNWIVLVSLSFFASWELWLPRKCFLLKTWFWWSGCERFTMENWLQRSLANHLWKSQVLCPLNSFLPSQLPSPWRGSFLTVTSRLCCEDGAINTKETGFMQQIPLQGVWKVEARSYGGLRDAAN